MKQLDNIITKMNTILGDYMELEQQYLQVVEERNILKRQISEQKADIELLKEQSDLLKLVKGTNLSKADSEEVKDLLNDFIGQIDKCLSTLNS
ncbi:MAG: hypothetical protein AB8B69_00265 [Chitinophagales bacterium]